MSFETATSIPKAVVFDCFGVLYADRFRERLDALPQEVQAICWQLDTENSTGQLSDEDFYTQLAPLMSAPADELQLDFNDTGQLTPGMTDLIADVHANGTPTFMLTNIDSRGFLNPFLDKEYAPGKRVRDLFGEGGKYIVASCDVGILKPEPGIYRALAELTGTMIRDWFYVDDSSANVRTAHAYGALTYRFHGENTVVGLRRALAACGVLPPTPVQISDESA